MTVADHEDLFGRATRGDAEALQALLHGQMPVLRGSPKHRLQPTTQDTPTARRHRPTHGRATAGSCARARRRAEQQFRNQLFTSVMHTVLQFKRDLRAS